MRRPSKSTASPLRMARNVATLAALVTIGAAVVMTVAVLTDDTTLTLTGARIFVWAWLAALALYAVVWTGDKIRAIGARR